MAVKIDFYQSAGKKMNYSLLEGFIKKVLSELNLAYKDDYFLSIAIIGKTRMKSINKRNRGKNEMTDVLSFGCLKRKGKKIADDLWGEIFISYDKLIQGAKIYKHSVSDEAKVLLTHAILHLVGYDHKTEKDLKKMQKMERIFVHLSLSGR